jgi:hypothetical protein
MNIIDYHARIVDELTRDMPPPPPVQMTEIDVHCNACGRRWTFAHVPADSTREHTLYARCSDCCRSDQE